MSALILKNIVNFGYMKHAHVNLSAQRNTEFNTALRTTASYVKAAHCSLVQHVDRPDF